MKKMTMKKIMLGTLLAAVLGLTAVSGASIAQDKGEAKMGDMHRSGMIMGGMMDVNGMMKCPMAKSMSYLMPELPKGHEKLQLQMQADIMQAIAKITKEYADQLEEGR